MRGRWCITLMTEKVYNTSEHYNINQRKKNVKLLSHIFGVKFHMMHDLVK